MSTTSIANPVKRRAVESESATARRAQLIAATVAAIAEHGLSHVTLAKVASRAGLTAAMVNFHFESKEALLLATLRQLSDEYEAAMAAALLEAGSDPARRLEALLAANLDPGLAAPDKIAVWSAFWGEARARRDYMAICGARDAASSAQVRAICRDLIARDGYAPLAAEVAAAGFEGILEDSWQCFLADDSAALREERAGLCHGYLEALFPRSFQARTDQAAVVEPASLDPKIDAAWDRNSLPGWVYDNAEFTALEKEAIFKRHWLLVGHGSEAPRAGDYLTLDVVGERALVIRGRDGQLRAFHNICRHRASRIVKDDRGHCPNMISCPFHGWTYDFEGRLKVIPAAKTFPDLDKSQLGLVPLDLEIWQGFVFVRFGGAGPGVGEIMAPAEAELAPYRLGELQPLEPAWQESLALDWKLIHDVDNEGYHVPRAHPGLQQLVGDSYRDETLEGPGGLVRSYSKLQDKPVNDWSGRHYQRLLPAAENLPESHRRVWLYYGFFPNTVFAFYPDSVEVYGAYPIAQGRALYRGASYALPDERRDMKLARYLNRRVNHKVGQEDLALSDWTASGMRSSGYRRAILSDLEQGVRAMHDGIRAALPVAKLETEPPVGQVAAMNARLGAGGDTLKGT